MFFLFLLEHISALPSKDDVDDDVADAFEDVEDTAEDFQDDLDDEDVLNNVDNIDGDGRELEKGMVSRTGTVSSN